MEATTYHDPAVAQLLDARFIAAKVDVDSRPDIEERYGEYGWPATVIFSPDGEELGKYRGYIAPEAFADILRDVTEAPRASGTSADARPTRGATVERRRRSARTSSRGSSGRRSSSSTTTTTPTNGGWGKRQKAAVAADNAWALDARARRATQAAKERVLFTLEKQRAIIDPVWGGIYQYSAGERLDASALREADDRSRRARSRTTPRRTR